MTAARLRFIFSAVLIASAGVFLLVDAVQIRRHIPDEAHSIVLIEPEQNARFHPRTRVQTSADTSGGGFVFITGWNLLDPDYGRRIAGETGYPAYISRPGRYYVWIRALWNGACANSVTLLARPRKAGQETDDAPLAKRHLIGNDTTHRIWHWVLGPTLDLEMGEYEFLMGTREQNASVDCILLTMSPDKPALDTVRQGRLSSASGTSPSTSEERFVFSDNFTGGADASDATSGHWQYDDAQWKEVRASGIGAVGPHGPRIALAQAVTDAFSSAHIKCAISASDRAGAGVFFGKQSDDDYFAVRLAGRHSAKPYASKVQIGCQHAGSFTVLAEAEKEDLQSTWERIDVRIGGSFCRVDLGGKTVLQTKLPREPRGYAGLYADGRDEMLDPQDSLVRVFSRPERRIVAGDVLESELEDSQEWPSLIMGYTPQECCVARWTNIDSRGAYAKRLELTRRRSSADSELLAECWGIFDSQQRLKLTLQWRAGVLSALLDGRELCTAKIDLKSDLAGIIRHKQPRVLFGDFGIETFRLHYAAGTDDWSNTGTETLGGPTVSSSPSDQLQPWAVWVQEQPELRHLIATTRLDEDDLPCGLAFFTKQGVTKEVLWVVREPTGGIKLEFALGGKKPMQKVSGIVLTDASTPLLIQLVVGPLGLQGLVQGQPVLHAPRIIDASGTVAYLSRDIKKQPPPIQTAEICRPDEWITLGYGWPSEELTGRVLHGNASVEAPLYLSSGLDKFSLRFHGSKPGPGSGYELKIRDAIPPGWIVFRDGKAVGSGVLDQPSQDWTLLRFGQNGSVIFLEQDYQLRWFSWEPYPLRQGFVGATVSSASTMSTKVLAQLRQSWDVICSFHQEMEAELAAGLWKTVRGHWQLAEPLGGQGFLVGRPDESGHAELSYRGQLDDQDLLIELRMAPLSLTPDKRLALIFHSEDQTNRKSGETVEFVRSTSGDLNCILRRGKEEAKGGARIDDAEPQIIMTALRTGPRLVVELDHVPVAVLLANYDQRVEGLTLTLDSSVGQPVMIRWICLTRNPLSPNRMSQPMHHYLHFLRDLFLSAAAG